MKQMRPFMSNQGLDEDPGKYDLNAPEDDSFDGATQQEIVVINKGETVPENLKNDGIILEVQPSQNSSE